jgi:hypothetical protein
MYILPIAATLLFGIASASSSSSSISSSATTTVNHHHGYMRGRGGGGFNSPLGFEVMEESNGALPRGDESIDSDQEATTAIVVGYHDTGIMTLPITNTEKMEVEMAMEENHPPPLTTSSMMWAELLSSSRRLQQSVAPTTKPTPVSSSYKYDEFRLLSIVCSGRDYQELTIALSSP